MKNIEECMNQIEYLIEQAKGGNAYFTSLENEKDELKQSDVIKSCLGIYDETFKYLKNQLLKELLTQSINDDKSILNEYLTLKEKKIKNIIKGTKSKNKLKKFALELKNIEDLKNADSKKIVNEIMKCMDVNNYSVDDEIEYLLHKYSTFLGNGMDFHVKDDYYVCKMNLKNKDGSINEEYVDTALALFKNPKLIFSMKTAYRYSLKKEDIINTNLNSIFTSNPTNLDEYVSSFSFVRSADDFSHKIKDIYGESIPDIFKKFISIYETFKFDIPNFGKFKDLEIAKRMDLYNMVNSNEFKALTPSFEEKKQQAIAKIDEEISKIKVNMPNNFPYENYLDFDRFDYRNFGVYHGSMDCTILNCIRVLLDYKKHIGEKLNIKDLIELEYVPDNIEDYLTNSIEEYASFKTML